MKKGLLILIFAIALILIISVYYNFKGKVKLVSPLGNVPKEKPLDKYTFDNLKKTNFKLSEITIGKLLKDGEGFSSYMFYFKVASPSTGSGYKKVSGLINLPKNAGTYPVIVMLRGYVDREKYTTGEGTRRSAEEIASNSFITLVPDFLGYGESDKPSINSIEERFQTYTTALTLLASIKNLNKGLETLKDINFKADIEKVGIWGHSNGGHIALAVLAVSGKNYPTVLWNPVSKPFPYSILYFTDEFEDHGRALRFAVANFEKDYDIEKYSPTNYYNWINAPMQLHQAVNDEAVPIRWSDQLNEKLEELEKDVTYFTYPGENHNFNNGNWGLTIQRSINFYNGKLETPKAL